MKKQYIGQLIVTLILTAGAITLHFIKWDTGPNVFLFLIAEFFAFMYGDDVSRGKHLSIYDLKMGTVFTIVKIIAEDAAAPTIVVIQLQDQTFMLLKIKDDDFTPSVNKKYYVSEDGTVCDV